MKPILAPHKEQDGWVYARVKRTTMRRGRKRKADDFTHHLPSPAFWTIGTWGAPIAYRDTLPWSRIISSRRVEEAVETADYLKRCAEEGISARLGGLDHKWNVYGGDILAGEFKSVDGATLREAYHRYKSVAS